MKNIIFFTNKLLIFSILSHITFTESTSSINKPKNQDNNLIINETPILQDKRNLIVSTKSKPLTENLNERKLCPCKGGRRLEQNNNINETERKMVDHNPEAVKSVDMYKGEPNGETISDNIINSTDITNHDQSKINEEHLFSADCCLNENPEFINQKLEPIGKPEIIIEPLNQNRPDPLMGILSNMLGNVVKSPHMIGKPHVSGFVQITKEHVLPNGQVEVEHINEPMNSSENGMIFGKPQIEIENQIMPGPSSILEKLQHRRRMMINPLTGLLSSTPLAHSPFEIPENHGMMIMSKPIIHEFEIPLNGPHMGPIHKEIIHLGNNSRFNNENILNKLIGDLLLHRERPDVDLNEWHQRNSESNQMMIPIPSEDNNDLNHMLLGLLNEHNQQNKKFHLNKQDQVEMQIPLNVQIKKELSLNN